MQEAKENISLDVSAGHHGAVRVVCEYAGSGEVLNTFNFDFLTLTYAVLEMRVVHYCKVVPFNLRVFLGHMGSELSVNPGLFGRDLQRAKQESQDAWQEAQQVQKHFQATTKDRKEVQEIVLSLSTYSACDTFAGMVAGVMNDCTSYLVTWLARHAQEPCPNLRALDPFNRTFCPTAYTRTCYCQYKNVAYRLVFEAHCTDGLVITQGSLFRIALSIEEVLVNVNVMAGIVSSHATIPSVLCSDAFRNNLDFMAEVPGSIEEASLTVRASKEFALQLFMNPKTLIGFPRVFFLLAYEYLSPALQEDVEVALAAFHRVGYRMLEHVPFVVRDNARLIMDCVKSDFKAIVYASDRLICDMDFMLRCLTEAKKQDLHEATQKDLVAQRNKAMARALFRQNTANHQAQR